MPVRLIGAGDGPLGAVLERIVRSVEPPVVNLVIAAEASWHDDVAERSKRVHFDSELFPMGGGQFSDIHRAAGADDIDREFEATTIPEFAISVSVGVSVAGGFQKRVSAIRIVFRISFEMFLGVVGAGRIERVSGGNQESVV